MADTSIEWTATQKPDGTLVKGYSFNGWIGCVEDEDEPSVMSEECRLCYAREGQNHRVSKAKGLPLWGAQAFRQVTRREYWKKPLLWQREAKEAGERRRVFAFSLGDIFEDFHGSLIGDPGLLYTMGEIRDRFWQLTDATPDLDWLVLTKRPQNVIDMTPTAWRTEHYVNGQPVSSWPRNVWVGTTGGTQRGLERRLPHLMKIPAPIRFVSQEPQLELIRYGVDLDATANRFGLLSCPVCKGWLTVRKEGTVGPDVDGREQERECRWCRGSGCGIDWLIIGGESDKKKRARPFDIGWARSAIRELKPTGLPIFIKQFGSHVIGPAGLDGGGRQGVHLQGYKHSKAGDPNEWPPDLRIREWPTL